MTMKVVMPARTSTPTLVPRAWSWNHRSRASVMNAAIVARSPLAPLHTSSHRAHPHSTSGPHDRGGVYDCYGRTIMAGPVRLRLGAIALGGSALLFAAFPLVRPFFRLDVMSPSLAAEASGPLASPS